ncbi:MAG TPA: hypothetical protein PK114_03200 [Smithellaceae bacterium]|nr:hypothetical protein [Smithellaceae bacterium]
MIISFSARSINFIKVGKYSWFFKRTAENAGVEWKAVVSLSAATAKEKISPGNKTKKQIIDIDETRGRERRFMIFLFMPILQQTKASVDIKKPGDASHSGL